MGRKLDETMEDRRRLRTESEIPLQLGSPNFRLCSSLSVSAFYADAKPLIASRLNYKSPGRQQRF